MDPCDLKIKKSIESDTWLETILRAWCRPGSGFLIFTGMEWAEASVLAGEGSDVEEWLGGPDGDSGVTMFVIKGDVASSDKLLSQMPKDSLGIENTMTGKGKHQGSGPLDSTQGLLLLLFCFVFFKQKYFLKNTCFDTTQWVICGVFKVMSEIGG